MRYWQRVVWVCVLVCCVVAAHGAFRDASQRAVSIGARDALIVDGFWEPESINTRVVRWSSAHARLRVIQSSAGLHILRLQVLNGYTDGASTPVVTLQWEQASPIKTDIPPSGGRMRRLSVLVQQQPTLWWYDTIRLTSTTRQMGTDPRALGVMVERLDVQPTTLAAHGSAWTFVGAIIVLCVLLAFVLRVLLRTAWQRQLLVVLITGGICSAGWADPWGTLPFLWMVLVVGGAAFGWCALVALWRDADGTLPGRFMLALGMLGWWVMIGVQAIQSAGGLETGMRTSQLWLALVQVVCLAAAAVVWLRARQRVDWRNAGAAGLAVGAVATLIEGWWFALSRNGTDFWILFRGARDWVRGGSLYDMSAVLTNHVGAVFKVPPMYGMLFVPFVQLDGLTVLFVYRVLSMGLFLGVLYVWWRMDQPELRWGLVAAACVAAFRPVMDTIANGQIDIVLLLCLVCGLWAVRRQHPGWAGVAIAVGTMFKIYPVILLAFFVLKRQWRALVGFVLGLIALNSISIAVMGWEMHRQYLFDVIPHIGGTTSWVENQTIAGWLARWVDTPFEAHVLANPMVFVIAQCCAAAVVLAVCAIAFRTAEPQSTTYALQYGLFVVLLVSVVPAAWVHYETVLVAVVLWLAQHLRSRALTLRHMVLVAGTVSVLGFGNQWSFHSRIDYGLLPTLAVSYKLYAMAVLIGLLCWEIVRYTPSLTWRGGSHARGSDSR